MNIVILSGRITKDPTFDQTNEGKNRCSFQIAEGEKQFTNWIDCVAFTGTAKIASLAKKGDLVVVEGSYSSKSVKKADGTFKKYTNVVVTSITIPVERLGGLKDGS